MKKIIVSTSLGIILLLSFSVKSWTQNPEIDPHYLTYTGNCTSIMVGRLASSDGSVITSHTCDGFYRTWLEVFPHSHYEKGTMHPVYWGTFSMEDAKDMGKVTKKGEVPEVEETYAFLNTAYPCLNEKQLAIGETTLRGKEELRNQEGLFKIEELAKIALQRCKTAREAIALIGKLAEEFGICGQHRYRTDSALWSFRETNRLAAVNWSKGRVLIEPAVRELEILASQEMPMVEKRAMELISEGKITEAQEYLTTYTNNFAYATMKKWEELKVTLWGDFRIWYR